MAAPGTVIVRVILLAPVNGEPADELMAGTGACGSTVNWAPAIALSSMPVLVAYACMDPLVVSEIGPVYGVRWVALGATPSVV